MMLISVVFPAPFGPSRAKISPRRMSRLMFLSACKPEAYVLASLDTETMGCKTTSRSTIVSSSSFIPLLLLARTRQRHATGWGHADLGADSFRARMVAWTGNLRAKREYGFQHVPSYRSNPAKPYDSGFRRMWSGPTPRDGATLRLSSIGCATPCRWRHGRRSRTNGSQRLLVLCWIEASSSHIELSVVQYLLYSPLVFVLSSIPSAESS